MRLPPSFRLGAVSGACLMAALVRTRLPAAPSDLPAAPPWIETARRAIRAISTVHRAEKLATAGDGTPSHPWTGWESAFATIPSSGGRIEFAPGNYRQTSPIKLPTGLTGWLAIVGGPGVTIRLTTAAPRFLDPDLTADHQTVRNVWIEGFGIDAENIGGKNHVIFGNYADGGGIGGWRRVDWDRIVIRDVRAYNVPVDPSTTTHRGGIAILSAHASGGEPIADTITRIYFEDIRIEGGNWGILVDGEGPAGAPNTNVDIDDVWLVRCWHSLLARQPRFASSNFQVGEAARVGHVTVTDCYGQFAADTGLELNSTAYAQVTGTTIEDAAVANFYYTDYNTPLTEPLVAYARCRSTIRGAVQAPYGIGWMFKDAHRSTRGGGRFRISDSVFERSGTAQATGTGAGVTAEGRLSELSILSSKFRLADVDVGTLTAAQRVLELDFQDDALFRLHDVAIEARAIRSAPGGGLSAITTRSATPGKTLTLDWDGVSVTAEISGPAIDYTIFTAALQATAASAVRGTIRRYRIDGASGDDHARAISIDLSHQVVAGTLRISDIDARKLPRKGTAVQLDHVSDASQTRKVSLRRIRLPGTP